jgi:beta-phosphoglucomutase-like phosphatase (HAD superfamily)/dTDP-glucose pyrophosphorylase
MTAKTNKLIIFDLDGVLVDSRELHYEALNDALRKIGEHYVITREEHLSKYDGLNTTRKLKMLTEDKGLPLSEYDRVWNEKQISTFDLVRKFEKEHLLLEIFRKIKFRGYRIAVASNSIRETVKLSLISIGVIDEVDYFVSNEDVFRTKPYPEMYWKCMTAMNALPKDTIIIEDSHIGRQGALDSGAHLLAVENAKEVNSEHMMQRIYDLMNTIEGTSKKSLPWRDNKLNVLIPMAGAGSRFAQAGYTFPKPLIEVRGRPMIQVVVENLNIEANYIFIVQREHFEKYNLKYLLNLIAPNCKIVQVDGITEGAACTTLLAKEFIDNDAPLVMANSDQFVEWNSNECLYAFSADNIDGGIITFEATHPKWSYAKLGEDGFVDEVAEKRPISNLATVGIYYWSHGSDYVKYAEQMISKNIRTNNEFYVAPVFNEAIEDNKKIRAKNIDKMWGIGTPEDLNYFLDNYKK